MKERKFTYNTFLLKGKRYYKQELPQLYREKEKDTSVNPFERDIFAFLLDFFSPSGALRIKTSGSTGSPKTLLAKKENMIRSARMTGDYLELKARDKALLCLPVDYIAGKMMIIRALVLGLDLWFTRPSSLPEVMQPYDFSALTPMQVTQLLHNGHGDKLSQIRNLLIGGAPLPKSLEEKLASFPNRIFHTYGMTETLSHIALRRISGPDHTEWFSPLPGIRVLSGAQDNLVIYAPVVAGKKAIVTRDIVSFSKKNKQYFKVLGRLDHVINSGGIKIFPEQVETLLAGRISFPFFIGSIPDDIFGEKITLFIDHRKLSPRQLAELRNLIQTIPDPHLKPRTMLAIHPFLFTDSGKIKRRETMQSALKSGKAYPV